jgi:hypothetical protein
MITTEIRHDDLPVGASGAIQARVYVYRGRKECDLHSFGSLRSARDFIVALKRRRYVPLKPVDYEDPRRGTYRVWMKGGGSWNLY